MPLHSRIRSATRLVVRGFGALVAVVLPAFLGFWLGRLQGHDDRRYENARAAAIELVEKAQPYATYRTVNWEAAYDSRSANYACDFTLGTGSTPTQPYDPTAEAESCEVGDRLTAAREAFRRDTVAARVLASDAVLQALQEMDEGFSAVFDEVMRDVWYYRSVPDHYNEVMTVRFANLERTVRSAITSEL